MCAPTICAAIRVSGIDYAFLVCQVEIEAFNFLDARIIKPAVDQIVEPALSYASFLGNLFDWLSAGTD
jgi:hypothetical protein